MLEEGIGLAWEHLYGVRPRVAGVCEWEGYSEAVQVARMEDEEMEPAPIFTDDLAKFPAERFVGLVDIIASGFPCPPVSCAGRRKGTEDERWIWPAIAGIIRTISPRWVILENVAGLVSANDGAAFGSILRDLAEMGFDAEWGHITAASVGASHKRERVFILGHAELARRAPTWDRRQINAGREPTARCSELADSLSQRIGGRGKSRPDTQGGEAGKRRDGPNPANESGDGSEELADAEKLRLQGGGE